MLTDAQWAMLEPLVEQCRPKGKTPLHDLRRTLEAILWQRENGAKWRAVPLNSAPGGARLRPLSAGRAWVSGSVCSTWCRGTGSSSG